MTCSCTKSEGLQARWVAPLLLLASTACGAADASHAARPAPEDDAVVASSVNTCPSFAFYFVLPRQIHLDEFAIAGVQGIDADSDDTELRYVWSATSGTFSTPGRASTQYRCSESGPQVLTVTTSDAEGCAGALALDVNCADQ